MSKQKLSYDEQLAAAKQFIQEHEHFLVVSHIQPDGDAISSTCAVAWILEQCGKSYVMVNESQTPHKFHYLRGAKAIIQHSKEPINQLFDAVIAVDCADFLRIGSVSQAFSETAQILNIDHHPTSDLFGQVHVIKDDAAATAEILYDLMLTMQLKLDKDVSECIYTGLLTDTGGFRYSNTSPKVMKIASELLTYGINGNTLAEHLLETLSFSHIQLLKKSLSTLSFSDDYQISWMSITQEVVNNTGASNEDFEGLVNYPRNIEGVEVGMLFKQTAPELVKVSFRSAGKVDVAQIAKSFGGGGHIRAAGCSIEGELSFAIEEVVSKVKKALI
jgi:phosphoesterase RecJ-like protein